MGASVLDSSVERYRCGNAVQIVITVFSRHASYHHQESQAPAREVFDDALELDTRNHRSLLVSA